jgi:predicted DNA-binding transcriptional regulator YafY
VSERQADPLSIVFMQNANVLMAWCHLRSDFRAFRLDRMRDMILTGVHFRPRRVPLLRDYVARLRDEAQQRAEDRASKG